MPVRRARGIAPAARSFGIVAALVAATGFPCAAKAGAYRVGVVIEPAYTFCVVATSSCSPLGRTSFSAEYKPLVTARRDLRLRVSRAYVRSSDDAVTDDPNLASSQGFQAASDSLDARLRTFDGEAYVRQETRAGYAYQHAAGTSSAYHATYASQTWFFGKRILRGAESPARQFRVLLKVSENVYESAGTLPQTVLQVGPYVTVPLDAGGQWRADGGVSIQQHVAGPGTQTPFSSSVSASLVHDFNAMFRVYARLDVRFVPGTGSASQTTTLAIGGKITLSNAP